MDHDLWGSYGDICKIDTERERARVIGWLMILICIIYMCVCVCNILD